MEECGLVLREMHESAIDVPGPVDAQAWADEDLTRYDFQPHNLRVEPGSGRIVSVLDLDTSTRGPAFSDIRDLLLTVFVPGSRFGRTVLAGLWPCR